MRQLRLLRRLIRTFGVFGHEEAGDGGTGDDEGRGAEDGEEDDFAVADLGHGLESRGEGRRILGREGRWVWSRPGCRGYGEEGCLWQRRRG